MQHLAKVLIIKIIFTMAWVALLLLFIADLLKAQNLDVPDPKMFLQLLVVAYLALAVGYAFGLRDVLNGSYPAGVIWVGIISNGGAFAVLSLAALFDVWELWGTLARLFMWLSLVATGAITSGLIVYGPIERIGKNRKLGAA